MKKKLWMRFLIYSSLLLFSCNSDKFDIDISSIDIEIKIHRMEKEFFSINPDSTNKAHQQFNAEYGLFYQRFLENITGIGMVNDPAIAYSLKSFLSDKYMREVFEDTEKKFNGNLSDIHTGLTNAFRYCRYYFPQMVVPEIVTFVSGFQYAVAVTDSTLGIGLDMYLGSDYENYLKAGFPLYKIALMKREYIVPDAMKAWLMTEFFSDENQLPKDVLGTMIQYGKILYLSDAVLPATEDTLKTGYTASQLEWCNKNEFNIWAHLVDNELLFSTDPLTINKFFNDAPFTSGLPKESPSKIGAWVGWQIVKSFMENNPGISIPSLMQQKDAQEILNKSKYKPGK